MLRFEQSNFYAVRKFDFRKHYLVMSDIIYANLAATAQFTWPWKLSAVKIDVRIQFMVPQHLAAIGA